MIEKYFEINDVGTNIKCKLYCNDIDNINNVVISCHGFCGDKENGASENLAEKILSEHSDFAVISFDWPCHGTDTCQKLDLSVCNDYLTSVIQYVKEKLGVTNIFSQATSFGGYLVLKYVSEHQNPFKKIALRCPAINIYDAMLTSVLPNEQVEMLNNGESIITGFDRKIVVTPEFLNELRINDICKRDYQEVADSIIIMHGTNDELIPYERDKEFCDSNLIKFVSIEGADHRFKNPGTLEECISYIIDFYGESLEKYNSK